MVTGGFETPAQAVGALASRGVDLVGLARSLALDPTLPRRWRCGTAADIAFPRFADPPEGRITAWYTMRHTAHGEDREGRAETALADAVETYESRDDGRAAACRRWFGTGPGEDRREP